MPGEQPVGAAFLDANVLIAAPLRDTILRCADAGLFVPYWSEQVLEEVHRGLVRSRLTDETRAQRLIATLRMRFPTSSVSDYRPALVPASLDPDDRHVIDAAVASLATILVTMNIRHFPVAELREHGVDTESPDEFLMRLFTAYPDRVALIIRSQSAALRSPPLTVAEVLANLRLHAPTFADRVAARLAGRR